MKLRILTLNAGLLSFFGGRLKFAPFVEERRTEMPRQLKKLDPDILLLQEVYLQPHREWILSELKDILPYNLYSRRVRHLGLENGLMLLSKMPVTGELHLFHAAPFDEYFLDSKGFLTAQFEIGCRTLTVINLHTTAGGFWHHPESPTADRLRANQIQQVIDYGRDVAGTLLVAGDFNAGPGVSEGNFRQFLDAGYVSLYDQQHPESKEVTWDPQNPLNRQSPHKKCPPQRIDHVLVRKTDWETGIIRALTSAICCAEEAVPVQPEGKVTISDHYGLSVEMEWQESDSIHPKAE